MEVTLYSFANVDRSSRVRWLLHELDLPLSEARLDFAAQDHRQAHYQAISPFCLVPAATIDELPVFESGAVMLSILDRVPNDLAPGVGDPGRDRFLSWLFTATASLDPYVVDFFFAQRDTDTPPAVLDRLSQRVHQRLPTLDAHLAERSYVLGSRFGAVDIVMGHLLGALQRIGELGEYEALRRYLSNLMERPAAVRAGLFDGIEM